MGCVRWVRREAPQPALLCFACACFHSYVCLDRRGPILDSGRRSSHAIKWPAALDMHHHARLRCMLLAATAAASAPAVGVGDSPHRRSTSRCICICTLPVGAWRRCMHAYPLYLCSFSPSMLALTDLICAFCRWLPRCLVPGLAHVQQRNQPWMH